MLRTAVKEKGGGGKSHKIALWIKTKLQSLAFYVNLELGAQKS